jgi:hypothetical protein
MKGPPQPRLIEIRCNGNIYPIDDRGRNLVQMPRAHRRDLRAMRSALSSPNPALRAVERPPPAQLDSPFVLPLTDGPVAWFSRFAVDLPGTETNDFDFALLDPIIPVEEAPSAGFYFDIDF